MANFRIDLESEMFDDLFFELEEISDGGVSHYCDIEAFSAENAAEIITQRLMPFFKKQFELTET